MNKLIKPAVLILLVIVIVLGVIIYKSWQPGQHLPPPETMAGENTPDGTPAFGSKSSGSYKAPIKPAPVVLDEFSVDFVSPIDGPVGTTVTLHGKSFSRTGNTVILNKFGRGYISNLSSPDGQTITFKIPATLMIDGKSTPVETGTYDVSVRDARGKESNLISFVVTAQ